MICTDDEIIDATEDIADDAASMQAMGYNGRFRTVGNRGGVALRVVIDPTNGGIVTGRPRP